MYSTSLTDSQWQIIQVYLPLQRRRKYCLRQVVDALLYLLKSGCQWRLLPRDFPPYQVVFYYFQCWRRKQLWQQINQALNRLYREQQGRPTSPSMAIVDAQSVKNSEWGLMDKGFDGHKRIQGRKRHLAVDTLGLVLSVSLSAANVHDSVAAPELLIKLHQQGYERLETVLADSAYKGSLIGWCEEEFGWKLLIATGVKGMQKGFVLEPQRWKVERSISWLQWNRRLSKDYEDRPDSAEAFVLISNISRVIRKI